mgnify:CR=1 FL=1
MVMCVSFKIDRLAIVDTMSFGMTEEKFVSIKSKQLSDQLKRKKADFIINTGIGRRHTLNALSKIIFFSKQSKPKIWRPGWLKRRGC